MIAHRLTVHLDLFFWRQHQPAFLDARAGVGAEFGAVILGARFTVSR